MLHPIKVVDIELTQPIPTLVGLEAYMGVQGLLRLHGVPLGYVKAPVVLGQCTAATLGKLILAQHSQAIIDQLLRNGLSSPQGLNGLTLEDLIDLPPAEYAGEWPLVTVAVCTRDRPDDMKLCLEAISRLDYPHLDVLVVDNAPQTKATKELVEAHYPQVRYVREPRPGLDWARNRAILAAKGEIIAYTDDDVVVDEGWVKAIAQTFTDNPEVMALTGLVVPYELETEAQVLFEEYGGFGKGFLYKEYFLAEGETMPWWMSGAGQYGTGANMAYRRSLFQEIGGFDPALDVGTLTNGGGDLEMFFRTIKEHHLLVYNPAVVIKHRHRRSYEKLKTQITNNGIGFYAYVVCGMRTYTNQFWPFFRIGLFWFVSWHLRRAWISFKHPTKIPPELVWAELLGVFKGLRRYGQARRQVRKIVTELGEQRAEQNDPLNFHLRYASENNTATKDRSIQHLKTGVAIRHIKLEESLETVEDVQQYPTTRLFFSWNGDLIGSRDLKNNYRVISVSTLKSLLLEEYLEEMLCKLMKLEKNSDSVGWSKAHDILLNRYGIPPYESALQLPKLPEGVKVSINLATFDRPDDLRNCLACLQAQRTQREVEIIVVDNNPSSNLTPPVVAEFSDIKLVREPRQGLAYARNAGFTASTGEIIIATDDDVTIPDDWLEKLVAPFVRADVMIVTGNVLPLQLETPSQQFFERYGGLGRGFDSLEANTDWFESSPRYAIPTWRLGATANAAFRSAIFSRPEIGLMDEALGPGMPSGVGEDTYLFYRTLKAGYTLLYEPSAYLWHKHRQSPEALRRQLYGYSKGHVSYNLTTWLKDGDWRGLYQIFVGLPVYHIHQIFKYFLRRSDYPLSLILLEIRGNLAGPWSLWRSHNRVRREGKSAPFSDLKKVTRDSLAPIPVISSAMESR
ncbi:MAG: glycosyltransferase [Phormidesmis sp.]